MQMNVISVITLVMAINNTNIGGTKITSRYYRNDSGESRYSQRDGGDYEPGRNRKRNYQRRNNVSSSRGGGRPVLDLLYNTSDNEDERGLGGTRGSSRGEVARASKIYWKIANGAIVLMTKF